MDKPSIQKQAKKLAEKINQPQEFAKELEVFLKSLSDEKAVAEYRRTIPNITKFFGVYFPVIDIISRQISKLGSKNPKVTLNLLKILWQRGFSEQRIIVAKALTILGRKAPGKSLSLIKSFLKDLDNWATCDTLATQGLRGIMLSCRDEVLDLALKCVKDKNKWIKRFAIATIVELAHNRKLEIPKRVFEIIKPLMASEDSDLKKVIAWALREISKREPEMVKNFLRDYQNSQDKNTQWIVREISKRLLINL